MTCGLGCSRSYNLQACDHRRREHIREVRDMRPCKVLKMLEVEQDMERTMKK